MPELVGYRLSARQLHIWRESQARGTTSTSQGWLDLPPSIDAESLRETLRAELSRHEICRCTIQPRDPDEPLMVLRELEQTWLHASDAEGVDDLEAVSYRRMVADGAVIDCVAGPTIITSLIVDQSGHRRLLVSAAAICGDDHTLNVLAESLTPAQKRTRGSQPANEPVQYADIVAWLADLRSAPEAADGRALWRDLDGASIRQQGQSWSTRGIHTPSEGRLSARPVSPHTVQQLRQLTHDLGTTLDSLLIASSLIVLWRSSRNTRATIGVAFDGRQLPELADVIGPQMHFLPLQVPLSGTDVLQDVLNTTTARLEEIGHWQQTFDWNDVDTGDATEPPWLPWLTRVTHGPSSPEDSETVRAFAVGTPTDRHVFLFDWRIAGDAVELVVSFDRHAMSLELARFLQGRSLTVADALAAHLTSTLDRLPILSAEELAVVGGIDMPLPDGQPARCLDDLVDAVTARYPDRTAVVSGNESFTFAELARRADVVAQRLARLGIGPESPVAVILEHDIHLPSVLLGILRAGGAYLIVDPGWPVGRVAWCLRDAHAVAVITRTPLRRLLGAFHGGVVDLDQLDWNGEDARLPVLKAAPKNLAYLLYTSGSTGQPKGVMVHHAALVNYVTWAGQEYFQGHGITPLLCSPAYDMSVTSIWPPLVMGQAIAILPIHGGVVDLDALRLAPQPWACLKLTPSHLRLLEQSGSLPSMAPVAAVVGGETLRLELVHRIQAAWPRTRIYNEYGPTETTVGCCVHWISPDDASSGNASIGKPIRNVRLYVLDEFLAPAPVGTVGEIFIAGDGVGRGYAGLPALTASSFLPDLFGVGGERMYRTGDLGRRTDCGRFEYLQRRDRQVKVRGFRVELPEIEAAIMATGHALAAIVIARTSENEVTHLHAYVATDQPSTAVLTQLRPALKSVLPPYMLPDTIDVLPALPLAASGKVDQARLPEPSNVDGVQGLSEDGQEAILAAIWAAVLGVDRVGPDDRFFDLGGDSMRGLQVTARARELGFGFRADDLFRYDTVRSIVRAQIRHADGAPVERFSLLTSADVSAIPAAVDDAYPLTALQSGMMLHTALDPSQENYAEAFSFRITSVLDVEMLRDCFGRLIGKHPVLRTSFLLTEGGSPLQLVHPPCDPLLEYLDLADLSEDEQASTIAERCHDMRMRAARMTEVPAIRAGAYARGENDWQLVVAFHHAILDGWSMASLLAELSREYGARLDGQSLEPTRPTWGFREFVALERTAIAADVHRDFWRQYLDGCEATPLTGLISRDVSGNIMEERIPVSADLLAALRRSARTMGVPLKHVFLAAHTAALSLWTDRDDVVTGAVVNCRPYMPANEESLGLFLNTLPVRLKTERSLRWSDIVTRSAQAEVAIAPHRWYPLARIQHDVNVRPLFDVAFNFVQFHAYERLATEGMAVTASTSYEATNYPLCTHVRLATNGTSGSVNFTYRANGIRRDDVAVLAHLFAQSLDQLASNPDARWRGSWRLLPESTPAVGSHQRADVPHSVLARIWSQADESPQAVAVRHGERQLTYADLKRAATALATKLVGMDVRAEAVVGLVTSPSLEQIVGALAILEAGGAFVPIDVTWPQTRIGEILKVCGATIVVASSDFAARQTLLDQERVLLADLEAAEQSDWSPATIHRDQLAYVITTSGSTGQPKHVAVSHGNLAASIEARRAWYRDRVERCLLVSPLSFDSAIAAVFWTLDNGGTLIIPDFDVRMEPVRLADSISEQDVTHILAVPSLYLSLAATGRDFPSLKTVITGGERCTEAWVQAWRALSGARLVNEYGPTEATIWATAADVTHQTGPIGIGRPIPGCAAYVLDQSLEAVPTGCLGELHIAGDGVTRGYYGDAAQTAAHFVPDPYSGAPGRRMYRSGDWVRVGPDGGLQYIGRRDRQAKLRGFRVGLDEIERALEGHADVLQCAAIVSDVSGREEVMLFVVGREGAANLKACAAWLSQQLPSFMLPARWRSLLALPLTHSGKVDRAALRIMFAHADTEAAPQLLSPTEAAIADIWLETVGERVTDQASDFFRIGGDSFAAMRVAARVQQSFNIHCPVRMVFDAPTLGGFGQLVDRARLAQEPAPASPRAARPAAIPLSFAQERLWFLDRLFPSSTAYNMPLAVRLIGDIDVDRLRRSINQVVARHEVLRTVFPSVGADVRQLVRSALDVEIPVYDLSDATRPEQAAAVAEHQREDRHTPFSLETGPLIRGRILRCSEREVVLLLTLHHIVTDGWSMSILLDEVQACYRSGGDARQLRPLTLQYADYAIAQRTAIAGNLMEQQLAYWRRQLADSQPLALRTDRRRTSTPSDRAAMESRELPVDVTAAVRLFSANHHVTLFMTVLAAFQAVLARRTRQRDVLIGTAIANRRSPELEQLIGLFVNTLMLRTICDSELSFVGLVRQVRNVVLDAEAHQDVPFERIIDDLQPERHLNQAPLCSVLCVHQNMPIPALDLASVKVEPLPDEPASATQFDLILFVAETGGRLGLKMHYSPDLFDATTIQGILMELDTLLAAAMRAPDMSLQSLFVAAPADQRSLVESSSTATTVPAICAHTLFEITATCAPTDVAIVTETEQWSYQQLNQRAERCAELLRHSGVASGSRVAIALEQEPDLVAAILGAWKVGATIVPLDPLHPPQRVAQILTDAAPAVVLCHRQLQPALASLRVLPLCIEDDVTGPNPASPPFGAAPVGPDGVAYVMYTSGSTGTPKGVLVTHRSLVNHLIWSQRECPLRRDDLVPLLYSPAFDAALLVILAPLISGARLLLPRSQPHLDTRYLARLMREHGASVLDVVPSVLESLLDEPDFVEHLPRIRRLTCGGDILPVSLVRRCRSLTSADLCNAYGPTEATIGATWWQCGEEQGDRVPIGRPIANTRILVVDEALQPVPRGDVGEICIAGTGVALGYLQRPALTAERFVPDPFDSLGARMYRSGDLGRRRDDGALEFVGRLDDEIKVRGARVQPAEIEAALSIHPAIIECAVVACEVAAAPKQLVAFVRTASGFSDESALKTHLLALLPGYMVPSRFVFNDGPLPRTALQKVDRANLRNRDGVAELGSQPKARPLDQLELALLRIWSEVLGVRVSVDDDFFTVGGHSLLAIRLVHVIERELGFVLPIAALFEGPSVTRQAQFLRAHGVHRPFSPLVHLQRGNPASTIVLIHPAAGRVWPFLPLVPLLPPDANIIGLEAHGAESGSICLSRITDMAKAYLRALAETDVRAPYTLVGLSMGGLIAYQMAVDLDALGTAVGPLILIDCPAPSAALATATVSDAAITERLHALGLSQAALTWAVAQHGTAAADESGDDARAVSEALAIASVYKANAHAADTFVPSPFSGTVTLLRSTDAIEGPDPTLGWRDFAREVRVLYSTGTHHTMLVPPHVQTVADTILTYFSASAQ